RGLVGRRRPPGGGGSREQRCRERQAEPRRRGRLRHPHEPRQRVLCAYGPLNEISASSGGGSVGVPLTCLDRAKSGLHAPQMALELAPLRPEHCDGYLAFFDRAFADNPAWSGCYCAFYEDPCSDAEFSPAGAAGRGNRAARRAQTASGRAHGVLAFDGGEIVGWCNAAPRAAFGNLRVYGSAVDDPAEPVGAVMCFVIAPARRREGIAT